MTIEQTIRKQSDDASDGKQIPEAVVGAGSSFTESAILNSHRILYNSDKGVQDDPRLAENMRRDPVITRAIQVREGMLASMPWTIKSDDETDVESVAQAAAIEACIRSVSRWSQAMQVLARFSWFGVSPISLRYETLSRPIVAKQEIESDEGETKSAAAEVSFAPVSWFPIHPDSTVFDDFGGVAVKVNRTTSSFDRSRFIYGLTSTLVKLTPAERAGLLMPVWGQSAPSFDDWRSSDRLYRGEGLRSHVWQAWLRRQLIDQAATHYAERLARGTTLIVYNGKGGKEQAEEIARSMASDFVTLVPQAAVGDGKRASDLVQIVEPTGTGYQIFGDLKEKADGEIANVIIPATLTMDAGATGMGSGVAAAHENTVQTVIDLDAELMADALTRDLVNVIARINFPNSDRRFRWVYPEVENRRKRRGGGQDHSRLEEAERMARMGVRISEDEVRTAAGFRRPKPGEPIAGEFGGGAGAGGIDQLLSDVQEALSQ